MYCSHCGKQIPDNTVYCGYCGTRVQEEYTPSLQQVQPGSFAGAEAMPMKWYKFLIYVQLFLGALGGVINAVVYFTGTHWENLGVPALKTLAYGFFPSLHTVDMITGICYVLMAVWYIVVRQSLVHYKKTAPRQLYSLRAFGALVSLFWSIAAFVILSKVYDAAELAIALLVLPAISAIIVLVFMSLEKVYFRKRQHLFIND